MSEMINVKIDNIPVTVEKGTTILDAARIAGVKIPTLCYLKDINAIGACRVCVCEVKGARSLVAACVYPLDREGTEVFTNTPKILEYRKTTVELILSDHDYNCTSCVRNRSCELQELALELGCDSERFKGEKSNYPVDTSTSYLIRDNNKCVLCRRCVAACKEYQAVAVIGANARGFDTHIACAFETNLSDNPCVGCGQCIEVCPTGALREKDEIDDVIRDLANPDKYVIVGTAPATRVGIGEEFGYPVGSNTEGKMVAALRRLGFNNVFDVDFTADLHSMGQYIQQGERMLMETVVRFAPAEQQMVVPFDEANGDGLNFLAGKTMDFINRQAMDGTLLAHVEGGVPNIILNLDENNARTMGQLIYFFEYACGLSGYLLGVNPFDQPGVEAYKKNMFALLGKPGYEEMGEELRKRLR